MEEFLGLFLELLHNEMVQSTRIARLSLCAHIPCMRKGALAHRGSTLAGRAMPTARLRDGRRGAHAVDKEAPRRRSLNTAGSPAQLAAAAEIEIDQLGPVPGPASNDANAKSEPQAGEDDSEWIEMGRKRKAIVARHVRNTRVERRQETRGIPQSTVTLTATVRRSRWPVPRRRRGADDHRAVSGGHHL